MNDLPKHRVIAPRVLYFGTPVALLSTLQPDGSPNLSPLSSAWALDDRLVLGMGRMGQGLANLERTREAVVNLPSAALWPQVERLAPTTGRSPVPEEKRAMGYMFEPRKFERAGLTPLPSDTVAPPRVAECPLQLEAVLLDVRAATATPEQPEPTFSIVELRVTCVHAHEDVTVPGSQHVDVARWQPLLYVFRHYAGTGPGLGRNFRAET
ncbi:flavin reductase family protein [Pyxidicoccus fallax]|uniref:Flavin reductase family protein n=1 Tax=Pyxidicoccus fallax TaxID=394095 RepID=A0A848LIP4_9BACT|nr:flavin reductase family protein [Pyxidicoccus fallax]NMO17592.1 flavin reductase family protein [Pyxidicoccus fallax]NPC84483.1 flavin reductase family protein [Pyxidicoccus fallax]